MNTTNRIIISFFAYVASYYLLSYILFPIFFSPEIIIIKLVTILFAFCMAILCWKKTAMASSQLCRYMALGALLMGSIGFFSGFFGPIIFYPGMHSGPLLGIFYTGPLGAVAGILSGALYYKLHQKTPV